jgi:hypothetical protein
MIDKNTRIDSICYFRFFLALTTYDEIEIATNK